MTTNMTMTRITKKTMALPSNPNSSNKHNNPTKGLQPEAIMHNRTNNTRGLTLIELLIVVSILGILAAIVIPKFSNAADSAKSGAIASQLNIIKKGMVLYKTDHNEVYPTNAQLITNQWQVLTNTTDVTGDVAGDDFGPYFQKPPMNSYMSSSVVATDNSGGWQYDASTGKVRAVVPQSVIDQASDYNLDPSDLVAAP